MSTGHLSCGYGVLTSSVSHVENGSATRAATPLRPTSSIIWSKQSTKRSSCTRNRRWAIPSLNVRVPPAWDDTTDHAGYNCGSKNVFMLGFIPAKSDTVVVLLCR